jgi:hypothetical protein
VTTYPLDQPVSGPGWFKIEINETAGTARLVPTTDPGVHYVGPGEPVSNADYYRVPEPVMHDERCEADLTVSPPAPCGCAERVASRDDAVDAHVILPDVQRNLARAEAAIAAARTEALEWQRAGWGSASDYDKGAQRAAEAILLRLDHHA